MVRPRWQRPRRPSRSVLERNWGRFVAVWASLNLVWVAFDLTYVALRPFWLQRNLHPIPGVPLTVPLRMLPDITPLMDPLKGIEPHRETQAYLDQFNSLDAALAGAPDPLGPEQLALLQQQAELTEQMIDTDPFQGSGQSGTLERIKNLLRDRADQDSAKLASSQLLSPAWLQQRPWLEERQFWRQQVLPLVETNYWRSINENARPTDESWRIDLLLFQWVFLLDILLRVVRLRQRIPGLRWRDALLRRWIDLPLLLPFWRWLRIGPVVERLQTSGLANFEPLRAVVSRGVVALLAVELFEVLALQLIDGLQGLVRSQRWPQRIRSLRSHQSVIRDEDERQVLELLRIWGPLLLSEVAPRLAPELQGLLGYSLRQSLDRTVVPPPLRQLKPLLRIESGLSTQLAGGMVDSLLDLSRSTGKRLGRTDDAQMEMLQRCIDRFWDELALSLETGPALERSQDLICALIEGLKSTYLSRISRARITALIEELDQLMASPTAAPAGSFDADAQAGDEPEAGSPASRR